MAKAEAKPASSTTKAEAKPTAEPIKKAPPVEEVDDREEDLDEDGEFEDEEEDGEEEDDEEEEDEEEEEEDVAPAKVAKKPPVVRAPVAPKAPVSPENDPTWWIPHAVLGVIVLIGVFGFFGFFNGIAGSFMKKSAPATSASAAPTPAASPAAPTATLRVSAVRPTPARPGAATAVVDADPTFGASRIVVRYKGAKNSKQERTKEQAKKRADDALKKLGTGAKFEEVAAEFSDEETAKTTGGKLGNFKRGTYDPSLVQTVEKLEVGKTSAVFESPEGYEIVTRSK